MDFINTNYSFLPLDLLEHYDCASKLHIKKADTIKKYGCHNKRYFAAQIVAYCFFLILKDIIENNITFMLPVTTMSAMLHMKVIKGDNFKQARQNGAFKDID